MTAVCKVLSSITCEKTEGNVSLLIVLILLLFIKASICSWVEIILFFLWDKLANAVSRCLSSLPCSGESHFENLMIVSPGETKQHLLMVKVNYHGQYQTSGLACYSRLQQYSWQEYKAGRVIFAAYFYPCSQVIKSSALASSDHKSDL